MKEESCVLRGTLLCVRAFFFSGGGYLFVFVFTFSVCLIKSKRERVCEYVVGK